MKKPRTKKTRIPPGALDGMIADIHRVRLAATQPRTPEDHRTLQLIEGQHKQTQEQGEIEHGNF